MTDEVATFARGPKPDSEDEWFPANVHITDTKSGEERVYFSWFIKPSVAFQFDIGNYSCDCNRALFYGRAYDDDIEDVDVECGAKRYRVGKVVDAATGETVYAEAL